MADFVKVATTTDIPEEGVLGVEAGDRRICLARLEGGIYAFEDKCSHRDFPLSAGELDEDFGTITCEWHGAEFDVKTGEAKALPATKPIQTFACRVEGEDILVEVG